MMQGLSWDAIGSIAAVLFGLLTLLTTIQVAVLGMIWKHVAGIDKGLRSTRESLARAQQRIEDLTREFEACRLGSFERHEQVRERLEDVQQRLTADERRLRNIEG